MTKRAVLPYSTRLGVAWTPPEEVRSHSGSPLEGDADFFMPPPPEIGRILSASTSLKRDKEPWSSTRRMLVALAVALPMFLLIAYIDIATGIRPGQVPANTIIGIVTGAVVFVFVYFVASRFTHKCDFVGEAGVCRARLWDSRSAPPKVEIFRFEQAAELRTNTARRYNHGIYSGTEFKYAWLDPKGAKVFTVKGRYWSEKEKPKPGHRFYFATASELAWSHFKLAQLAEELRVKGFIHFHVKRNDRICLGPGFIEFDFNGDVQRWAAADIESMSLREGYFSIKNQDAKWYSRAGKFRFQYGQMSNGRIFLLAVNNLLGIRVS